MNVFFKAIFAMGLLAVAGSVSAVPITGSIAFGLAPGASWTPTDNTLTIGPTTADADGVIFKPATVGPYSGSDGLVSSAFGDYSSALGHGVDFSDFAFDPLTAGTTLWSFTDSGSTYSFTMSTLTIVSQTEHSISLEGLGIASITGLDDTSGHWTLTLNSDDKAFSFSSSAATVPEPGAVLLLGTGLLGLSLSRKRRKAV